MGSREEMKVKDGNYSSRLGGGRGGVGRVGRGGGEGRFLGSWAGRDPVTHQAFISPKHPTAPCDAAPPEKGEARRAQTFSRSRKLDRG